MWATRLLRTRAPVSLTRYSACMRQGRPHVSAVAYNCFTVASVGSGCTAGAVARAVSRHDSLLPHHQPAKSPASSSRSRTPGKNILWGSITRSGLVWAVFRAGIIAE